MHKTVCDLEDLTCVPPGAGHLVTGLVVPPVPTGLTSTPGLHQHRLTPATMQ